LPVDLTVRKWGSGLGIFLPKSIAAEAGIGEGEAITQTVIGPGKIMIERQRLECQIHDYGKYVVVEVMGIAIPLKRATAITLSNKVGTNDGFLESADGTVILSVTPDAGCLKLSLNAETASDLKLRLRELEASQ
jgi:hypothetical protein